MGSLINFLCSSTSSTSRLTSLVLTCCLEFLTLTLTASFRALLTTPQRRRGFGQTLNSLRNGQMSRGSVLGRCLYFLIRVYPVLFLSTIVMEQCFR